MMAAKELIDDLTSIEPKDDSCDSSKMSIIDNPHKKVDSSDQLRSIKTSV